MRQDTRDEFRRHPRATASPLSLEVRAAFGEARRMAARTFLSSFEARKSAAQVRRRERAPQDDGFDLRQGH
jgi:hypothetical protein